MNFDVVILPLDSTEMIYVPLLSFEMSICEVFSPGSVIIDRFPVESYIDILSIFRSDATVIFDDAGLGKTLNGLFFSPDMTDKALVVDK